MSKEHAEAHVCKCRGVRIWLKYIIIIVTAYIIHVVPIPRAYL